jgi:hypothetical protein
MFTDAFVSYEAALVKENGIALTNGYGVRQ